MKVVLPVMKKTGIGFYQYIEGRNLHTKIYHIESGEQIESNSELPLFKLDRMNEVQSLGAIITYMKRYSLSAMLGIVAEDDTDAAGNTEPAAKKSKTKKEPIDLLDDLGNPTERFKKIKEAVDKGDDVTFEVLEKHYEIDGVEKAILKKIGVK